jgi:hypothetical protein
MYLEATVLMHATPSAGLFLPASRANRVRSQGEIFSVELTASLVENCDDIALRWDKWRDENEY